MAECTNKKCNECSRCKKLDIEDRINNSWEDVELFRLIKGRLPSEDGDDLTKSMAKEYIDRFVFGKEGVPSSSMHDKDLQSFAFHVYASTNLAYENDIPGHGSEKQRLIANG